MIRLATEADAPRLVEMGVRFLNESTYSASCPPNSEAMLDTVKKLIAKKTVLVSIENEKIVGMIGFVIHRHFLSGQKICGEVFWWVEPEHRGQGVRLLHVMELIARKLNCFAVEMIAPNEKVAAFYTRRGYEFLESNYQKRL